VQKEIIKMVKGSLPPKKEDVGKKGEKANTFIRKFKSTKMPTSVDTSIFQKPVEMRKTFFENNGPLIAVGLIGTTLVLLKYLFATFKEEKNELWADKKTEVKKIENEKKVKLAEIKKEEKIAVVNEKKEKEIEKKEEEAVKKKDIPMIMETSADRTELEKKKLEDELKKEKDELKKLQDEKQKSNEKPII
jgi:hypothetical protein